MSEDKHEVGDSNIQKIDKELFQKFLEITEKSVQVQSIVNDRIIKNASDIKRLSDVIYGDGQHKGLLEKINDITETNQRISKKMEIITTIQESQNEIKAQQKVLIKLATGVLAAFIIALFKMLIGHFFFNTSIFG